MKAAADKLEELRDEINLLKGINPSSTLNVLKDFSTRIPEEMKVQVDQFRISERTIDMRGTIRSLDDVYVLKKNLEESEYVESIEERPSTAVKDRRKFEFKIKLK